MHNKLPYSKLISWIHNYVELEFIHEQLLAILETGNELSAALNELNPDSTYAKELVDKWHISTGFIQE